jgi:hypothetical protein
MLATVLDHAGAWRSAPGPSHSCKLKRRHIFLLNFCGVCNAKPYHSGRPKVASHRAGGTREGRRSLHCIAFWRRKLRNKSRMGNTRYGMPTIGAHVRRTDDERLPLPLMKEELGNNTWPRTAILVCPSSSASCFLHSPLSVITRHIQQSSCRTKCVTLARNLCSVLAKIT